MIFPLILFALGLGAVAAYEFSPSTRTWVDEHVRALQDAKGAHSVAEAHLDAAAQAAPPLGAPMSAAQQQVAQGHAATAQAATATAAQKTALVAATARTQAQRAVAIWMAALTLAMQEQIAALTRLQIAKSQLGAPRHRTPTELLQREGFQQELEAAQKAFDAAVERIRQAKIELSKLGAGS